MQQVEITRTGGIHWMLRWHTLVCAWFCLQNAEDHQEQVAEGAALAEGFQGGVEGMVAGEGVVRVAGSVGKGEVVVAGEDVVNECCAACSKAYNSCLHDY